MRESGRVIQLEVEKLSHKSIILDTLSLLFDKLDLLLDFSLRIGP